MTCAVKAHAQSIKENSSGQGFAYKLLHLSPNSKLRMGHFGNFATTKYKTILTFGHHRPWCTIDAPWNHFFDNTTQPRYSSLLELGIWVQAFCRD